MGEAAVEMTEVSLEDGEVGEEEEQPSPPSSKLTNSASANSNQPLTTAHNPFKSEWKKR